MGVQRSALAWLTFVVILLGACQDSRRQAVKDIVRVATEAPFTLGPASDEYSGYAIEVRDESLPLYNRVFSYVDAVDSTRADSYKSLAADIFWHLPITRVTATRFTKAAGDTLVATVIYERPDPQLYDQRFLDVVFQADSTKPSSATKETFSTLIRRVRQELQVTDTAHVYVASGPRVVRFRTATMLRDSVRADSAKRVALSHLTELVNQARISITEVNDWSSVRGVDGGAISGMVDPGSPGWYKNTRPYTGVAVQCEASRGDNVTTVTGYIIVDAKQQHEPDDFLCLWAGEDGRRWNRVRPQQLRVRLVAHVHGDSLFGPWVLAR